MHKSALLPIFKGIINLQNPARNHFIIDVLDLRPSKDRLDPLKQTAIISIRGHKSSRISAEKQSRHATFVDKVVYCQVFSFLHTISFSGEIFVTATLFLNVSKKSDPNTDKTLDSALGDFGC